jgi:general stress protein YciG
MSGTREGGLKAKDTNKDRYGSDFYSRIGAMGGKKGPIDPETGKQLKGFALNRELASSAGAKGGTKSRRGKAKK